MPSFRQRSPHTAEENCTPQSDVTIAGTPKRETHPVKKASVQAAVVVEESGIASAHHVVRSTTVKRWVCPPLDTGKGPTRSM